MAGKKAKKIDSVDRIDQKAWTYLREQVGSMEGGLEKIAISDGSRSYTYGQMFQNCEQYAAVFSALGMTGAGKARVGLIGTGAAETIFAFYGLNMTGAEVSLLSSLSVLRTEKILQAVKDEHLTDLILTDEMIQEKTLRKIILEKDELGLRFVLLLHLPMGGSTVPAPMTMSFEQKTAMLRSVWGPLYMDFLVNVYGHTPVSYAEPESCDTAAIIHTSGTTGGSGKPIVMSDRALNAMIRMVVKSKSYDDRLKQDPVCALMVDLSNAYGIIIQVHLPLCLGGKVVTVPGNGLNPLFFRAIPAEGVSVLFCTGAVLEMWMKMPEVMQFDFSSLKGVILGGSSISANDKRRYLEFIRKHGGKAGLPLLNGYGISELGGVCTLSSPDVDDESIGCLLDGIDARLFDEDTETFHTPAEAPLTGVLYLRSEAMSGCVLDGKEIVKTEVIDGLAYVCTNDLVRLDEDGRFTYLGRANRYFLNNSGIKYQSGRVETEISRQAGIRSCGIVPVFNKTIHDNIPMLCVSVVGKKEQGPALVREALLSVFKTEKSLPVDNVPRMVLIAEELPRNANGKIDLYAINRGEVSGDRYTVELRKKGETITDLQLQPSQDDLKDIVAETYKGIAKDMMDESLPGQFVDGLKQVGAALKPEESDTTQAAQARYWQMMNQLWQMMSMASRYAGNNMRTTWESSQRFMQMLFWMYSAWQNGVQNQA